MCTMSAAGMPCPDEAKLGELLIRALPVAEAAHIEAHLADCDDCRNLLFALASSGGERVVEHRTVERIGRFEILDVIGQGAMGIVYRARDPELDRIVAIKVRRGQSKLDVEGDDRLQREAKALARLTHPNVVAVYEAGRVGGETFVAMECVEGVSLGAWLATPRAPEEVLSVLTGVGRGLAAAHAAGLVHRDVKPHNVFVGDGTAKVGDFGLVRAEPGGALPATLTMTLSVTGALIGTPAYMAPEQLCGQPATELSDQFSFCVTLFEALYGTRPFAGTSLDELRARMAEPIVVPASPRVAARVKNVLRRGLAIAPCERFASMTALLDALTHRSRAAPWLFAVALVATGGTASAVMLRAAGAGDPCTSPDPRAQQVFATTRAEAITHALVATKAPGAEAIGRRVGELFGAYGARWQLASDEVCRSTTQGRQSKQLGDRQRACLERRLARADELASVLANTKDAVAATGAVSAVLLVPDASACTVADLGDREPPPADKVTEVTRIETQLDRIDGLFQTSQLAAAAAEIDAAVAAARATGYSALLARALIVSSMVAAATDRFDHIEELLDEAAREAAKARDDQLAAEAWTRRVYVVGVSSGRYDDAQQWARAAEAAVLRAGNPPDLRASLHMNVGTLLIETDKLADAERELLAALELRTKRLPHDPVRLADVHNNLAALYQRQGKMDAAEEHFLHALELSRSVQGEQHQDVFATYVNLGFLFSQREQPDRALEYLEKALVLGEQLLGPDHVNVGVALDTMGLAQVSLGHYAEAAKLHRRAHDIMLARLGPKHRRTGFAIANLARAAMRQGDFSTAIEAYQQATTVLAEALGPTHDLVARQHDGLGTAYRLSGDLGAARHEYELALSLFAAKQSPEAVYPRFNLAQMALERGDCKTARSDLATAAAEFSKVAGEPSALTAQAAVIYCDAVDKRITAAQLVELEAKVAAAPIADFEAHTAGFIYYARARGAAALGDKRRARVLATQARELYATVHLLASQRGVEAFIAKELQ